MNIPNFRVGQSSSLLGLLFTNNIYLVDDVFDPIGKSDYTVIIINTNMDVTADSFVKCSYIIKVNMAKCIHFSAV